VLQVANPLSRARLAADACCSRATMRGVRETFSGARLHFLPFRFIVRQLCIVLHELKTVAADAGD